MFLSRMLMLVREIDLKGDRGKSGAGWARGCKRSTLSSFHLPGYSFVEIGKARKKQGCGFLGQGTISRQFPYQFSGFFSSLTYTFGESGSRPQATSSRRCRAANYQ